jgi:uncharacterized protein (AIM24 family)
MSEFSVREVEGMRQVCIDIHDETVRARAGALKIYQGSIDFVPRLPRVVDVWRSIFTREARVRPYYTGTGTIMLQPSLGGFHIREVHTDERWILEPGVYWASDGSVDLGLYRERFWPSLWAGDGFCAWKTVVNGEGRVAINAPGPVETVEVEDGEMRVQGRLVLGRTEGLRFHSCRSAPFPRNFLSGQTRLRVYRGTGKLLVCWTPYWNQHMYENLTGETIDRSLFE